jgi:hypothetical protein
MLYILEAVGSFDKNPDNCKTYNMKQQRYDTNKRFHFQSAGIFSVQKHFCSSSIMTFNEHSSHTVQLHEYRATLNKLKII